MMWKLFCLVTIFSFISISGFAESPDVVGKYSDVITTSADKSIAVAGSNPRQVHAGDSILLGDVVNTSPDQKVELLLSDHSKVWLSDQTELAVHDMEGVRGSKVTQLIMQNGTVTTQVQKLDPPRMHFYIKTKTAVMGVRGTEFVTKSSGESTALYTLSGEVLIAKDYQKIAQESSRRSVKAGKKSELAPGDSLPRATTDYSKKEIADVMKGAPTEARKVAEAAKPAEKKPTEAPKKPTRKSKPKK